MSDSLRRGIFSARDQTWFAEVSGDYNPIHIDSIAARRTQAGAVVVHGIHTLLWSLDALLEHWPNLPTITALKCQFKNMLYLEEETEARLANSSEKSVTVEVLSNETIVCRLTASFAVPGVLPTISASVVDGEVSAPERPYDLKLEELSDRNGRVAYAVTDSREIAHRFPHIHRHWGDSRIADLLCSTRLVGMVCPGLHSVFSSVNLITHEAEEPLAGFCYRVTSVDPRFRRVTMTVQGNSLAGDIVSFSRHPPVPQATMEKLAAAIRPKEFSGATALIIGGSRGLGEVTAKLLAAGGAAVIVTYLTGRSDALRVQKEIEGAGGHCSIVSYDAKLPPSEQLAMMDEKPDCLYYFATPLIYRPKSALFLRDRLDEFMKVYVTAFYDLYQFLVGRKPEGISAFYPSTTFVEERPAGMTEYAMAKAAAEALCADMTASSKRVAITVNRLPRLATDQTAALTETQLSDPAEIMLPLIRKVQSERFS